MRARLSDATFFWKGDLKVTLADRLPKLDSIVFHEKLGTQGERVRRIAVLARALAPIAGADPDKAERAAMLAKADLVSAMVGEFPELQGLMGRYYAAAQGEDAAVATAIEDHYKPQGPGDRVPTDPVAIAVALADKLDTLVGFWAIDEKPTGSKDPYALRRAALGVIRIVIENGVRVGLAQALEMHGSAVLQDTRATVQVSGEEVARISYKELQPWRDQMATAQGRNVTLHLWIFDNEQVTSLLAFFADRLKVYLRDNGARHDLIDAVFALPGQDDLLMIVRRVEALGRLLDSDDGKNLLAGTRRAANILKAEEKKDGAGAFAAAYDPDLLVEREERSLAHVLDEARSAAATAVAAEDFEGAMRAMARLRPAVDAFFDKVTVNAADPALRLNRLRLLEGLRQTTLTVADFSCIVG